MAKAYDTPPPVEDDDDTEAPRPIGVSADYRARRPITRQRTSPWGSGRSSGYNPFDSEEIAPRYFSGAERELVAGLSREDRAELQLTMRDLGLIGPKTRIVLGTWDNTSAEAFRQVLAWANATGSTWDGALQDMTMSAELGVIGDEEEVKLPPNPLDLQAVARRAGTEHLGGPLTTEQSSQLQSGLSAQMMADNAPGSAGQEEYVRQKTRSLDPVRFDARNAVKVANVISRMLGGDMPSEQQQL